MARPGLSSVISYMIADSKGARLGKVKKAACKYPPSQEVCPSKKQLREEGNRNGFLSCPLGPLQPDDLLADQLREVLRPLRQLEVEPAQDATLIGMTLKSLELAVELIDARPRHIKSEDARTNRLHDAHNLLLRKNRNRCIHLRRQVSRHLLDERRINLGRLPGNLRHGKGKLGKEHLGFLANFRREIGLRIIENCQVLLEIRPRLPDFGDTPFIDFSQESGDGVE